MSCALRADGWHVVCCGDSFVPNVPSSVLRWQSSLVSPVGTALASVWFQCWPGTSCVRQVKDDTVPEHPCSWVPCVLFEPRSSLWLQCWSSVLRAVCGWVARFLLWSIPCSERAIVRLAVAVDSGVISWNRAIVCVLGDFCRLVSSWRAWA